MAGRGHKGGADGKRKTRRFRQEARMAGVTVRGQIDGAVREERFSVPVGSAVELGRVAVRLLVEEFGTDQARQILRDELAEYLLDYKGAGADDRSARRE